MDAPLVEVAERFGPAVPEGEGCEAFGGVGEPEQLGEPERSVGVGDVAETPPAPIAASCWSSPTSRTLPPHSTMYCTAASREMVSAIPASSITTRVDGPMLRPSRAGRAGRGTR